MVGGGVVERGGSVERGGVGGMAGPELAINRDQIKILAKLGEGYFGK